MATAVVKTDATLELSLKLNEEEARALDGLTGYNVDAFLATFYAKMGRAYLEPYEEGLRSLFSSIRRQVPPALNAVDEARKRLGELRGVRRDEVGRSSVPSGCPCGKCG